jgi:hypothetical protein
LEILTLGFLAGNLVIAVENSHRAGAVHDQQSTWRPIITCEEQCWDRPRKMPLGPIEYLEIETSGTSTATTIVMRDTIVLGSSPPAPEPPDNYLRDFVKAMERRAISHNLKVWKDAQES